MILTPEQAEERLNSPDNLANRFIKSDNKVVEISIHRPGRKNGDESKLNDEEVNAIALRARSGEPQKALASEFNVTQANISYIERGDSKSVREDLIAKNLEKIQDKAIERLMTSMDLLDDEKLKKANARDLASVTASMAKVIEKTLPKDEKAKEINLIIYAPEVRTENAFKRVEI